MIISHCCYIHAKSWKTFTNDSKFIFMGSKLLESQFKYMILMPQLIVGVTYLSICNDFLVILNNKSNFSTNKVPSIVNRPI